MTLSVKFRKTDFKYSTLIGQTLIWNVFLVFNILLVHIFTDFWHELNCTKLNESYFYRFYPNYDMVNLLISSVDQNSTKNLTLRNRISKSWEFARSLLTWSSKNSPAMFLVGHYHNNYTTYWHNSWSTAVTWMVVKYFVIEASISHTNKLLNYIIRILRVWPWLLKKTGSKS